MLNRVLRTTAARRGTAPAILWRGEQHSWEALASSVGSRAADLRERGVEPGSAVAILLPNCPDFVASFFAATSLGAVAVPLNPGFTAPEVIAALDGLDVPAFVADDAHATVAAGFAEQRGAGVTLLASDLELPLGRKDAPPAAAPVAGEADALYGYSSGTTGASKRLSRTQANLVAEAENFTASVAMTPDDVILGVAPFFHAHGLGNCVLAAACSGAALAIQERFDPRGFVEASREHRVSVIPGVPFMYRLVAKSGSPADFASLRLGFSAGSPLTREIFEAFDKRFGKPIRQLYGCSEAGSVTINLDEDAVTTAESVGRPMRNVELRIVDEHGASRAPGAVGELIFSSPALTGGYHGREELNRKSFRDGWFHTGDLGFLDSEGRLTLTGRTKLFVSTPAGKVDPGEVESCIASHPDVEEVVVVAVPARGGAENVKAAVVARASRSSAETADLRREIVRRCGESLAQFKIPRIVEFWDEIPRSATGKILRSKLVVNRDGG